MTRLKADLTLLLVGIIWGFGFVPQKTALAHMGPFLFVAAKFFLSSLVILPFAIIEIRKAGDVFFLKNKREVTALILSFVAAVILQQYGMTQTDVVHTSFFTGLYVVLTPLTTWILYRRPPSPIVITAGVFSVIGIWCLCGEGPDVITNHLGWGDVYVLTCAAFFSLQVTLMGHLATSSRAPYLLSLLQYITTFLAAFTLGAVNEPFQISGFEAAWREILFSGIVSAGIAYTLQAIAQQHTPSSDSAVILSSETLVGGLVGVFFMGDPLTQYGVIGCVLIFSAILMVEIGPLWQWRHQKIRPI